VNGWSFVASYGDVLTLVQTETVMNVNRDVKKSPQPVALPRPWPDPKSNADVTEAERVALREELRRSSVFSD
jgi:outer membrane lipopolysaccharide assembly protein LptE/RlpB